MRERTRWEKGRERQEAETAKKLSWSRKRKEGRDKKKKSKRAANQRMLNRFVSFRTEGKWKNEEVERKVFLRFPHLVLFVSLFFSISFFISLSISFFHHRLPCALSFSLRDESGNELHQIVFFHSPLISSSFFFLSVTVFCSDSLLSFLLLYLYQLVTCSIFSSAGSVATITSVKCATDPYHTTRKKEKEVKNQKIKRKERDRMKKKWYWTEKSKNQKGKKKRGKEDRIGCIQICEFHWMYKKRMRR